MDKRKWGGIKEIKRLDAPLGHNNRNVTPHIQLSCCVRRRYMHTCIPQAVLQRTSKHCAGRWLRRMRAGLLRGRDVFPPRAQAGFAVAVTVLSSHTFLLLLLLLSMYKWEKNGSMCRKDGDKQRPSRTLSNLFGRAITASCIMGQSRPSLLALNDVNRIS